MLRLRVHGIGSVPNDLRWESLISIIDKWFFFVLDPTFQKVIQSAKMVLEAYFFLKWAKGKVGRTQLIIWSILCLRVCLKNIFKFICWCYLQLRLSLFPLYLQLELWLLTKMSISGTFWRTYQPNEHGLTYKLLRWNSVAKPIVVNKIKPILENIS